MATLTIRNLSSKTHQALRERAARNGRSMEAEARVMLGDEDVVPANSTETVSPPLSVEEETLLTDDEKASLSPEVRGALARLRKMFEPKPGEPRKSLVDELIAERRAEAARE